MEVSAFSECFLFFLFFFPDSYGGQITFSAIFGLYTGGQYALVTVLVVHFMEVTLLPTGFGVMVFMLGVGYLSGPPLAGSALTLGVHRVPKKWHVTSKKIIALHLMEKIRKYIINQR